MGGIAVVAAGRGTPMSAAYDDRPDAGPARRRRSAATTCAGSASRWPSAATGCRRSTRCSTGSPAARGRPPRRRPDGSDAPTASASPWRGPRRVGHTARRVDVRDRLRPHRSRGGRRGADPAPPGRRPGRRAGCTSARAAQRAHRPGVLALVVWVTFLVVAEDASLGDARSASSALGLLVDRRVAGLLILVRWLPSRGRHATPASRTAGPRGRVSRSWPTSACWSAWPLHLRLHDLRGLMRSARSGRSSPSPLAAGLRRRPRRRRTAAQRDRASDRRCSGAGPRPVRDGRAIRAWHLGQRRRRAGRPDGRPDRDHARQRGRAAADPARPARRRADRRRRPVGGAGLQPRRPGPRTPKNAHGVDLNRNYPYDWVDLDGNYESGPQAGLRAGDPGDDARSCARSTPTAS